MSMPLRGEPGDAPFEGRRLLRKALIAVQFSPVLMIADRTGAGVAAFQEEIRGTYPNLSLELEQMLQLQFRPDAGLQPLTTELPIWRMSDTKQEWRVSLTQEAVSLEVPGSAYTTWTDFSGRMCRLLEAVAKHFAPAESKRIGARFVNAATIDRGDDPRQLCAKELVSVTGDGNLSSASLVWRFEVDEGELILQSGVTAPGTTYDPQVLDQSPDRQWYLDIDVIKLETSKFDASAIGDAVTGQVRRAHAMYRWAMPKGNGVS